MQNDIFKSPVAFAQAPLKPINGIVNGMETAIAMTDKAIEASRHELLSICDVSALNRFGVKGPNAAEWLAATGLTLPEAKNSWTLQGKRELVLRLGGSEYLIEEPLNSQMVAQLNALPLNKAGVHKVIRNDASFIVSGKLATKLFSEVCAIDLSGDALEDNRLVMTIIAGVSVTVLRQMLNGQSVYRIWCDGTYGPYLWKTLLGITEEYGGGAIGFSFYHDIN